MQYLSFSLYLDVQLSMLDVLFISLYSHKGSKKKSYVAKRLIYFHLSEQGEKERGDAFKKEVEDFMHICLTLSITTLSEDWDIY